MRSASFGYTQDKRGFTLIKAGRLEQAQWRSSFDKVQPKGFTLIELMVAISIVAILATVGVVLFSNAQKNARDGKRRADIDAISRALEVHYQDATFCPTYTYCAPNSSWFAENSVPKDPLKPSICGQGTCNGSYIYVDVAGLGQPLRPSDGSFAPEGAAGGRSVRDMYKICTDLETVRYPGATVDWDGTQQDYCKSNQQN